ncbi:MAG: 2Fe-2S iron-sulfur cluster-binding protein, partial [Spirochaetota bacterium]
MSITARIISDHRQDTIEVGDDESLLGALQRTGWHLPAPCGGIGRCGKCLVSVDPPQAAGTRAPEEERFTGDDPARRLACRTYPTADLTVTLPGHVTPPASADTLAKGGGIEVPTSGKPVVVLERLRLNAPTLEDQQSVLRRVRAAAGMADLRVACEQLSVA